MARLKVLLSIGLWVCLAGGTGKLLDQPVLHLCLNRPTHAILGTHRYYFSWRDFPTAYQNWLSARNWCRKRCMDLVSFEKPQEYFMLKRNMLADGIRYLWTSGRRCDFSEACQRPDLQPVDVHGWFWSGSSVRMRPTTHRAPDNDWSHTGGFGVPQPDNRECATGQRNESCMAVLNNYYNDGVRWHDVACHHRKQWVCEDSPLLLNFVRRMNPHLRL
ncbi:L-selectin-like [Panulirus ornatus]|uniref:L-selectin-like n=1 Tax=Panulirus ornatus TaxID=150431 RepID=UPI003A8AE194